MHVSSPRLGGPLLQYELAAPALAFIFQTREVPMAGRSGPTFQKRQKEKARQEKQRGKVDRRSVRKQEKALGIPSSNNEIDYAFNPYEGLDEYVDPFAEGEDAPTDQSGDQPANSPAN